MSAGKLSCSRERFADGEIYYSIFEDGSPLPIGQAVRLRSGRLWCARELSWIGTTASFDKTLRGAVEGLAAARKVSP